MFRLRDLSFRYKIPLRGSLLVVATALLVTASLMFREYDALRGDLIASSASMARLLAKTLVTPLVHDDVWRAFEIVNSPFHTSGSRAPIDRTCDSSWSVRAVTTVRPSTSSPRSAIPPDPPSLHTRARTPA